MKKSIAVLVVVFCLFSFVLTIWSQIPQTLSYQGVLKDAGGQIVPNGDYQLTFKLYPVQSGGSAIWTEVQTVAVVDGIFNVILGSVTPLTVAFDVPYWLGVTVGAGNELPRIALTSAAYSLNAKTVVDSAITTAKIADGAVTQAKLAAGISLPPGGAAGGDLSGTYPNPTIAENAVTSVKIQDGTIQLTDLAFTPLSRPLSPGVSSAEIADNAVTTPKIEDGAITQAKLSPGLSLPPGGSAGGDLTGTYPNPTIAAGAVNTTKLADNAVTSAKIVDGAVAVADLADNAVTSAKIQDGTVAAADLASNAVTTVKIQDGAVTQAKLDPGISLPPGGSAGGDLTGTYPNPTIAAGAVNTTKLADNAVTSVKIVDGTVAVADLADNAVTSAKIQDGSVAAADLASNAVTTEKINDGAVTQAKIASGVTLPPSGTAGGDLTGTYPNPIVDGLQGRAVASTAPSSGQVLKWSGLYWTPAADEVGTSLWAASGNDIYNINTGYVGIGTISPRSRLEVYYGNQQTNFYRYNNYPMVFYTNNLEGARIRVQPETAGPNAGENFMQLSTVKTDGTNVTGITFISNGITYLPSTARFGIGTSSPIAPLNVTTQRRYAGYFTADSLFSDTHVIHAQYNGTGLQDARAVYGYSNPAAGYGYGGEFIGGWRGIYAIGSGGSYTGDVHGVSGIASGSDGYRYGVYGYASNAFVSSASAYGVFGYATGYRCYGVYGTTGTGEIRYAGYFDGNVNVTGNIYKAGGTFKIDHPLDPENKYLYHSFVESPDMKNIYDGVVTLDENGQAWVDLPEWFEALNRDFRYQLTCIGGYAPVYVSRKISDNRFQIAGGTPGLEVSWQVTGIRQDAWAQKNRIPVEELKRADERGLYLHPEAFGLPESRGIDYQLRKAAEENSKKVQ